MAIHYTDTTKSTSIERYGVYSNWKNVSHTITANITIGAGGVVSYILTSTHSARGNLSLWVEINGKTIINSGYYGWFGEDHDTWNGPSKNEYITAMNSEFPYGYNSTCMGTAGTAVGGSISVKMKLIKGSSYSGWPDQWEESLKTEIISRNYWKDNTAGNQPLITDNGNNTFSITGYSGTIGDNNNITETRLQYQIGNGDWITTAGNSLTQKSITAAANEEEQTISARTRYKCKYGGDNNSYLYTSTATLNVKNYVAPSAPSDIRLDYSKNRLTIKENWLLKWTASNRANDNSYITGYRIRIYKNNSTFQLKNSGGIELTKELTPGYKEYYYDFEPASIIAKYCVADNDDKDSIIPSNELYLYDANKNNRIDSGDSVLVMTNNAYIPVFINTTVNSFAPGDIIQIHISAYTRNGNNAQIFSSNAWSETYTVKNAGVMRVKTSDGWKEGQVCVKVDGNWKEADIIKIKTPDGWEESI